MRCECLFCQNKASIRLTVPHVKPQFLCCEAHATEFLAAADRYRKIPGMVQVDLIR